MRICRLRRREAGAVDMLMRDDSCAAWRVYPEDRNGYNVSDQKEAAPQVKTAGRSHKGRNITA
jgi:hypothetical protein